MRILTRSSFARCTHARAPTHTTPKRTDTLHTRTQHTHTHTHTHTNTHIHTHARTYACVGAVMLSTHTLPLQSCVCAHNLYQLFRHNHAVGHWGEAVGTVAAGGITSSGGVDSTRVFYHTAPLVLVWRAHGSRSHTKQCECTDPTSWCTLSLRITTTNTRVI